MCNLEYLYLRYATTRSRNTQKSIQRKKKANGIPRQKRVSKSSRQKSIIKFKPQIPKSVRRVVESSGENVEAWLSLLVPGHEAAMRRRKEERLSVGLTLVLSSAITAAILAA